MATKREVEFLLEDYRQAWTHYRHVEDERLRYLTFYFTATLGSAAIAAPLIASSKLNLELQLITAAAFLAVVQAVTFFVSATVRRFGSVLTHYSEAMARNRRRRAALARIPKHSELMIAEGLRTPMRRPSWMYGAQKTAELTLVGFLLAGVVLAVVAYNVAAFEGFELAGAVCGVVLAGAVAATALVLWSYATGWLEGRTEDLTASSR